MDVKKCDICDIVFEYRSYVYQKVSLPSFGGVNIPTNKYVHSENSETVGGHNSNNYDVCVDCFDKIVEFLRGMVNERI